jgi:hypothetical protein
VLSALIVWLILWLNQSKYPAVVIAAFQAPDSLAVPDNSSGLSLATKIDEWVRSGGRRPKQVTTLIDPKNREAWKKSLDPTAGGLVLYFSAAVGADADGPFVWLPPQQPEAGLKDADKLPVDAILAELKKQSGPKLLVFDVAPPTTNWARNEAFNDFARALKERDSEIAAVSDLVVLCSVDEDQTAWAAAELRSSVFAHHFDQGLRGAGHEPNTPVTVASLFTKYLKEAVNNWAVKNRLAGQTPILLPQERGLKLAEKVILAQVPPEGYTAPPAPPTEPQPNRTALQSEWKRAEELARKFPESVDPMRWRQYLDWLLRWEQVELNGCPTDHAKTRTIELGGWLEKAVLPNDPFVTLAVPTESASTDNLDFNSVWKPATGTIRDAWKKLTNNNPDHAGYRRWAAQKVLERVSAVSATAETFEQAELVLSAVDSGLEERPIETHLVRIFAVMGQFDSNQRSNPELWKGVKSALKLREQAERAAWGVATPAYPEQVYRWVRNLIPIADGERQRGEDLLGDAVPAAWAEAETRFSTARKSYDIAAKRAEVVSAALATRDRLFVRLPYYAHWVAATRSEQLILLETAARKAHALNDRLSSPPTAESEMAAVVAQLQADTDAARTAFEQVEKAYREEVERLRAVGAQPSDWHALDAAMHVPFWMAADQRETLFKKRNDVTQELAKRAEDRKGETIPPTDSRPAAYQHVQLARAYLGEPLVPIPLDVKAPHKEFRKSADEIGRRLRVLHDEASRRYAAAISANPLIDKKRYRIDQPSETGPADKPLADAARFTRLADPVSPVAVSPDPVDAERRYWRHEFLLWQADRCIRDNWADVGHTTTAPNPPNTARWYCKVAANKLIDRAQDAARGLIGNPTAEQQAILKVACEDARKREPVWVMPDVPPKQLVFREYRQWLFSFGLIAPVDKPTGYPTYWLELPERYQKTHKVRGVDRHLAEGQSKPHAELFQEPDANKEEKQRLTTAVWYRGHLVRRETTLEYTGDPTIELVYQPPVEKPRMALQADERVISGALTVLIDRSGSMRWEDGVKTDRTPKAVEGLKLLLKSDALPEGTHVTLGGFYGDPNKTRHQVDAFVKKPKPIGFDAQAPLEQFGVTAEAFEPGLTNASTPLALSVQDVLSRERFRDFWPDTEKFTGARTLVILTDGDDTVSRGDTAGIIYKALMDAPDPVQLHIVFFDMNRGTADAADKQYRDLEDHEPLGKQLKAAGKLPVRLSRGVKDGNQFAREVLDSFRPLVRYEPPKEAPRSDKGGVLVATMSDVKQGEYAPTEPLSRSDYELKSGYWKRTVRLELGDQLVLKARKRQGQFDLFVPPSAYDYATRRNVEMFPHAITGPANSSLRMTVPKVAITSRWSGRNATLTLTMERDSEPGQKELRLNRPSFPWFDVTDPKPDAAGALPRMKVENDPALVAPAWNLTLLDWDRSQDHTLPIRTPAITGYWIDEEMLRGIRPTVFPAGDTNRLKLREVGELPTPLGDGILARIEKKGDQAFLMVVVDYQTSKNLVYLRAVGWGGSQPGERHAYYDSQHQYTIQYGPLSPDHQKQEISFHRYSVDDLRAKAKAVNQAVTVTFPKDDDLKRYKTDYTANLKFGAPTQK